MTLINLVYRRPDGVNPEGTLLTAADGSVAISSVRRYDTSDGEMTRAAFTKPLGATGVYLDPGTWDFELVGVSDGKGGYLKGDDAKSTRLVPSSGTFDVDDLDEVPGSSGQGLAPEWKVYIDAAIAGLVVGPGGTPTGSGPGGAFIAVDVVDTTVTGRALMTTATAAAARTTLGTPPAASPTLTGITTVADLTVTGNTSFAGTASFVDGSIAQADVSGLVTALAGKATDSGLVHTTGAETVAGVKSFSDGITVPANTLDVADVSGLQTTLTGLQSTLDNNVVARAASTGDVTVSAAFVLRTTNPSALRPTLPSYVTALWDLPGVVPPANMLADDLWLA